MAKDFLGKELHIGDEVVFMQISYRSLRKGKITKLGDKKATIESNKDGERVFQFYNQIIKIDNKV